MTDEIINVIGILGGFAISLSLVPQVYHTYKTKCADDISYHYQFIYMLGTALVNIYAIHFGLFAVYIPCLLEFSLIVILTIMKSTYPSRGQDSFIKDVLKEESIRTSVSAVDTLGEHRTKTVPSTLVTELDTYMDGWENDQKESRKYTGNESEEEVPSV